MIALFFWSVGALTGDLKSEEIVFVKRQSGQTNVFKQLLSGGKPELIFKSLDRTNPNSLFPKWSHDGQKIFFTSFDKSEWKLFEYIVQSKRMQLSSSPPSLNLTPTYAKDLEIRRGSLIYRDNSKNEVELYKCKNFDRKTNPCANEASWNSDNSWVIFENCTFSIFNLSSESCDIFVVKPDGTQLQKIGKGRHPQWRPKK